MAAASHDVHTSGRSSYTSDDIVVGLQYLALVVAQLARWNAHPVVQERDSALNLARVTVDAGSAVDSLTSEHPRLTTSAEAVLRAENAQFAPLDVLMWCLRERFAHRNAGWTPTMGKNRVVRIGSTPNDQVGGHYVIVGGGAGPVAATYQIVGGGAAPVAGTYQIVGGGAGPVAATYQIVGGGAGPVFATYQIVGGGQAGAQAGPVQVVPWRPTRPGSGARVGIIDTKLAPHPWLSGAFVAAAGDLWSEPTAMPAAPSANHATFVAGLVLKQSPGATICVRAGLDEDAEADSWSIAQAIARMGSDGVDVLNLSFGCATDDGRPPLVLEAALRALDPDTVVVAAAGNHGRRDDTKKGAIPSWPAALEGVVAVGANQGTTTADFSPDALWVDAQAPGVDVVSTSVGRGGYEFARWSGTSFAAATVSGAIAAAKQPGMTGREAWDALTRASPRDHQGRYLLGRRSREWPSADACVES